MAVHTSSMPQSLPGDGSWLNIQGVSRSFSPDPLDHGHDEYDDTTLQHAPDLSSSVSSVGDTRSNSTSSTVSQMTKVPPQPIKKHSRLHNMLHNASGHIRAGLRMTPLSTSSSDHEDSVKHRRSSTESNQHHNSYSSSVSSTWSKFSSSFKNHHSHSGCSPPQVPRLAEKYGSYIKPDQQRTFKGMGATSKKNIGSGATAVIRLVRHDGQILAVKEFKKREKNESERDYEKRMRNEYCISKTVSGHPHVINTLDLVKDERDRWCIVMEYVSLNKRATNLPVRVKTKANLSFLVFHSCLF